MKRQILRRNFLKLGAASVLAVPMSRLGARQFSQSDSPRFRLGLAAYSFRDYFEWFKGERQKPKSKAPMDLASFIDYCADHNCDGAELTAYFIPRDADRAYYNDLKWKAHVRGVSISGTAIATRFSLPSGSALEKEVTHAKRWIEEAALLGAPYVRVFAGEMDDFKQGRDRIDGAIDALRECARHAGELGVFLGVENHGAITPQLLLEIIGAVDSKWVGINLDTGNFFSNTPYRDIELCVPHAINVQVKASMQTPQRSKYPADYDRLAKILASGGYQGFVTLEYEDGDPLNNVPKELERLRTALAAAS